MENIHKQMRSVVDFGARPNSLQDDTAAFERALCEDGLSYSVYVPEGIYYISRPLSLMGQNLQGAGMNLTRIVSSCEDLHQPIVYASRSCVISDLTLSYDNDLITGKEAQGERVGIILSDVRRIYALQRGSTIRNVRITNVGTALYDGDYAGMLHCCASNVLFESLEISDFSFRGVDFLSKHRQGCVFTNIYAFSRYASVDAMLSFQGGDSELQLNQVNLEYADCHIALRLTDVMALAASTLHFANVRLVDEAGALISLCRSSGDIRAMTVYFCQLQKNSASLIRVQEEKEQTPACKWHNSGDKLSIGMLCLRGLNNDYLYGSQRGMGLDLWAKDGGRMIQAEGRLHAPYCLLIDHYTYRTYCRDREVYECLPREEEGGMRYLKLGELPEYGPLAERPVYRLCAHKTRYYDTDHEREWRWNGLEWQ